MDPHGGSSISLAAKPFSLRSSVFFIHFRSAHTNWLTSPIHVDPAHLYFSCSGIQKAPKVSCEKLLSKMSYSDYEEESDVEDVKEEEEETEAPLDPVMVDMVNACKYG